MTQEDKELLLKDLCARLPYHTKGHVVNACNGAECDKWLTRATFPMFTSVTNNCRLYLRSISSMTEVEKHIFDTMTRGYTIHQQTSLFDWLNAHHFDYRGLIEKNLALDCTGLHIYD
jgi:hypothetical protein